MPLTLNQALLLVLTLAAVIVAVFLVRLFVQLGRTAAEGEKTLAELRALAERLTELDLVIKDKVETLGTTIEASKKAAVSVGQASAMITASLIRPSSRYLPLIIPVVRYFFNRRRKKRRVS